MADPIKHELVIELEYTGEQALVEEYRIESDYLQHSDSFSVTLYNHRDPAMLRRVWRPLQPVKLYLDGNLQLVGRIFRTEGVGDSGAALQVSGRDYVGDLVDASADPSVRFAANTDLGDGILDVLRPFGITTLFGNFNLTRNLVTGKDIPTGIPDRSFTQAKLSEFKVDANTGAFEAANKMAARHGFMLQPVMRRDALAVTEPQYGQPASFSISRPGNVTRASAQRDYSDVPTVTIAVGRVTGGLPTSQITGAKGEFPTFGVESPNELGRLDEVKRAVGLGTAQPLLLMSRFNPRGEGVPGNAGLRYCPLFYDDKNAQTLEQLQRGIRRVIGEKLKDVLVYNATLQGHSDPETGAIYCIDTIGGVSDEIEDVHQEMWVQTRSLSNDGSGPQTQLMLTLPGAIAL